MSDEGIPDPNDGALPGAGQTLWTRVVGAAADAEGPEGKVARESLARQYWMPLYVYVRRKLSDEGDAQEVVQAFFAERVLAGAVVRRADRESGSFRWLLRRAMDCFLIDGWRRRGTLKRGGGVEHVPVFNGEEVFESLGAAVLPEGDAYDVAWVLQVSLLALDRLELECREEWIPAMVAYLREGAPRNGQEALAEGMGISAEALRQRLHRVRSERMPALMRAVLGDQCDGSPREMQEGWDVLCAHIPGLRVATGT